MRRVATSVLLSAVVLTGCQKAVFPKDQPRTQFETHERRRGNFAPMEKADVFGKPQPALRARLSRPD